MTVALHVNSNSNSGTHLHGPCRAPRTIFSASEFRRAEGARSWRPSLLVYVYRLALASGLAWLTRGPLRRVLEAVFGDVGLGRVQEPEQIGHSVSKVADGWTGIRELFRELECRIGWAVRSCRRASGRRCRRRTTVKHLVRIEFEPAHRSHNVTEPWIGPAAPVDQGVLVDAKLLAELAEGTQLSVGRLAEQTRKWQVGRHPIVTVHCDVGRRIRHSCLVRYVYGGTAGCDAERSLARRRVGCRSRGR